MALTDRIDHVFFDLDRTLWDFDTNSRQALEELYSEFRVGELTRASRSDFLEVYACVNDTYWDRYRNGHVSQAELRVGRFRDALRQLGAVSEELARNMGDAYVHISPRKTTLVDGALEVLEYLKGKYALHIVTNGFEDVQHIKLNSSGLKNYFGEVITSDRAGVKKPDAGIFRFAEHLTHALPHRSVMIGDHLEADIQGASNAGWHAVYFSPRGNSPGNHHHVADLRELLQLL